MMKSFHLLHVSVVKIELMMSKPRHLMMILVRTSLIVMKMLVLVNMRTSLPIVMTASKRSVQYQGAKTNLV